ncbi:MAG: energy-coupling factor ABC transporter ATP-binding protein, partial [Clostridiales bacterium]|nr:energy-coupling factor ABC transporter ATP-binding protein [Clostridiales bacterium]
MIEINNLSFRYEGTAQGVSGIHLNIRDGECVVLTGCSGCGKTTLTRLVNGLAPSFYPGEKSGTILLNGQDISELPVWKIGESVVSVFQNPKSQFFSSELAGEVAFACENYGFPQEEIRRRTDNAITVMGLDAVRNRPLDILSSGEKQRAAVASVYALCPKVFVCDEPTANLDEDGIVQLKETFCTLKKQGYTFLIAEHRLAWLDDLADRYIYMDDGVIDGEYSPS